MNHKLILDILERRGSFWPPTATEADQRSYRGVELVYPYVHDMSVIGTEIADIAIGHVGYTIDVVIASSLVLSHWVARHLMNATGRDVLAFSVDKVRRDDSTIWVFLPSEPDGMYSAMVWACDLMRDKNILIVEDILSPSTRHLVDWVGMKGGKVALVGAICNRADISPDQIGVPKLFALIEEARLPDQAAA